MATPTITPSTIDLVSLADVKGWCNIQLDNTDEDSTIQFLITGFSQHVLNKTGIQSFNSVQSYNEFYDGNGQTRMFLNNRPIVELISVTIGSFAVPFSDSTITAGVYVEQSKKSIAFRWSSGALTPPRSIFPYRFSQGQGNVQVQYTAGYDRVPPDLMEACMETVGVLYARKDWKDLASKALTATGSSGTTTYRNWHLTPGVQAVIDFYSRYARP